ncbi:MAG: hypothetical protein AAGE52_18015 [Myxococcota bacterium]
MKPGELIAHPVTMAALALWAVNDHLLKPLGGELVGKLSDVACLVVVPLIVPAAVELWQSRGGRPWTPASRTLWASAAFAAATMIAINTHPGAAWLYERGMGIAQWPLRWAAAILRGEGGVALLPVDLTEDPTDAWTAPAALVPLWLGRRRGTATWRPTA